MDTDETQIFKVGRAVPGAPLTGTKAFWFITPAG
jgi:hypothetical protein